MHRPMGGQFVFHTGKALIAEIAAVGVRRLDAIALQININLLDPANPNPDIRRQAAPGFEIIKTV